VFGEFDEHGYEISSEQSELKIDDHCDDDDDDDDADDMKVIADDVNPTVN
jgi:hypothetical protein